MDIVVNIQLYTLRFSVTLILKLSFAESY